MTVSELPMIRSHERMDYKRCPKKWYWKWRMGLTPRAITFGALELGTWVHYALSEWYGKGFERNGILSDHFNHIANADIAIAHDANVPQYVLDKAEELALLGLSMVTAYEQHYDTDESVYVIGAELPLEFTISDSNDNVVAVHRLKPDLVYKDEYDDVWLMEHKTAAQIRTEHLAIDDQARPYGAMAGAGLRKLGVITDDCRFRGVMYNFLRKGLSDDRETDSHGRALNKNGTVSRRQPAPLFVRHPVHLTQAAKVMALKRLQQDTIAVTALTQALRERTIDPAYLPKTPHNSCPKTCQYFTMCVAEEQGSDIRDMQRQMFRRENPYTYGDSTDIPSSFEMG